MIFADVVSIMSVVVSMVAVYLEEINHFYIGRGLIGITAGFNSALVPLYIKEISPLCLTGKTGSYRYLFFTMGTLSSSLIGVAFSI